MIARFVFLGAVVFATGVCAAPASVGAQGLLWSLPTDGTWVRYEGTYDQTVSRPDHPEGDLLLKWDRKIELKSVGQEMAEFEGQTVPCRWIEIKSATGKRDPDYPLAIDPGPAGVRIFKVLVPESRILGRTEDERGVPVSFIPIVRGYRKIGDAPVQPIESGALQVYPTLSLLAHYREIQPTTGETEDLSIGLGTVSAVRYTAVEELEGPAGRSRNEAEFWISRDVPFGLAKWKVVLKREEKDIAEPRDAYRPESEIKVEMEAHETGTDARSELVDP